MFDQRNFIHPDEWNRRVDLRCTGMTVHSARQILNAMGLVWWHSEKTGWTDEYLEFYVDSQNKLKEIISNVPAQDVV